MKNYSRSGRSHLAKSTRHPTITVREDAGSQAVTKRIESVADLAAFIRKHRKSLGMTQVDLAGASGLGARFIGDLERGKPTCEIGKTLHVLTMLGVELEVRTQIQTDE